MEWRNKTAADKAYLKAVSAWMVVYVGLVVALSSSRNAQLLTAPWNWAAAWTPSIPIAGVMWAVLRYMRDSDEFVRALTARQVVIATFLTQVACSAWGFLEIYAGAPRVPLYMVVVVFWAVFGAVKALVRRST